MTATAPAALAAPVEAPSTERVELEIVGLRPLISNRFAFMPVAARLELRAAPRGPETDADATRTAVIVDDAEGWPGLPIGPLVERLHAALPGWPGIHCPSPDDAPNIIRIVPAGRCGDLHLAKLEGVGLPKFVRNESAKPTLAAGAWPRTQVPQFSEWRAVLSIEYRKRSCSPAMLLRLLAELGAGGIADPDGHPIVFRVAEASAAALASTPFRAGFDRDRERQAQIDADAQPLTVGSFKAAVHEIIAETLVELGVRK